jgi:MobA/MobL family
MAIYYLGVKSFGRSAGTGGSVSTSAAAYRSGERIRDERTNHVYDHSQRRDIEYKEILLPSHLDGAGSQLDWARDRSQLWNAVERSEPRANARVAREYVLALPHELNAEQRMLLARGFARELSDRYHNAVDLALHQPRTDPRNYHAHLLATTREVTAQGLGAKTIAELNGSQRFELGLPRAMQEHAQIRARWADLTNTALREAGLDVRVSHIPNSEAILRPGAQPWLPRVAWEIERRGGQSPLGDRAREQFAQRREAIAEERNGARRSPEEVRKRAIDEWRAIRNGSSVLATSTVNPTASRLAGELERQVGSLRRELGRDDIGL